MSDDVASDRVLVAADSVEDAATVVVERCQQLTIERGARGFTAPELVRQAFEIRDGVWTRTFLFEFSMLPAAP